MQKEIRELAIRLLFFSDWRIQPLELAESMVRSAGQVDAILYGGDDVVRFAVILFGIR